MYNVFTDFHHASLLQSLILLFEKRLGGNVYRPIGVEWHTNGFWKVYDHPATVEQFLGIGGNTPDGTAKLNEVVNSYINPPGAAVVYKCKDIDSGQDNKAITLQGFMAMHFDIVIASLPYHIEPFKRLCEMHPNKPKLIYQIGNAWTVEAGLAPNIMASANISGVPENTNFISYHQEFDTSVFRYVPEGEPAQSIYSFVNCFNVNDYMFPDWQLFQVIEREMPGWRFRSYGGQCRDGAVGPSAVLADRMREARFIWHTKVGGDGYGHVVFNSAAVGRPLITKKSYYIGKMGEALMMDGVTCIDIENLSNADIVSKIHHYSEPERYKQMCENVYANFKKHVDFNKETEDIKIFLQKLI